MKYREMDGWMDGWMDREKERKRIRRGGRKGRGNELNTKNASGLRSSMARQSGDDCDDGE